MTKKSSKYQSRPRCRRLAGAVREVGGADRNQNQQDHLPAPGQPKRAPAAQLHQVVGETDAGAGQHDEEHGQGLSRVLAQDEERDDRRRQEEHAAHHRRSLLDHVPRRPLLADVLADVVVAQEGDEARPGEDRDRERQDAGQNHPHHRAR
jgi:hypothetical protein